MKKTILFSLIACLSLLAVSCQKPEEIWEDNSNPEVYIPRFGITNQTIWDVTSGTYNTYLGVYCAGVRPTNQKSTIDITYTVDNGIVEAYNADITSQYGGDVVILPESCYTLGSKTVSILPGEVDTKIPISFNIANVKAALDANPGKKVVIPFKLTSTSKYTLSATEENNVCMMEVKVASPTFYFFCNNIDGTVLQAAKLIYGDNDEKYKYDVVANGVPDGDYNLEFAIDQAALQEAYPDALIIPEDAVVMNTSSVYRDNINHAYLEFSFITEKLEFFKTYYLPVVIKNTSTYAGDPVRGKLFMIVNMKNEYEKSYKSEISVEVDSYGYKRVGAYSVKKTPTTFESDIIEFNLATNNTIAGAKENSNTSTTYNNRLIRLKIIPTADKSHYDIEYIPVTDQNKKKNTPDFFEPTPGAANYYDWNEEKFVLNYRWKHIEKKDTSWVNVSEIMQAN